MVRHILADIEDHNQNTFKYASQSENGACRTKRSDSIQTIVTSVIEKLSLKTLTIKTNERLRQDYVERCYKIGDILSKKDSSTVQLGISKSDARMVAIKTIKIRSPDELQRAKQELRNSTRLAHANSEMFPRVYDSLISDDGSELSIIFALIEARNLDSRDYIFDPMSEAEAKRTLCAVFAGIGSMHSKGLAHLDVKPSNLLAEASDYSTKVKIIDFGMTTDLSGGLKMYNACGTPLYWAPEVVACQLGDEKSSFGMPADVWAIGVMLHVFLSGGMPFHDDYDNSIRSMRQLFKEIQDLEPQFSSPAWATVSGEAKDFVKLLLSKDPSKRPTCAEALEHPWLRSCVASSAGTSRRRSSSLDFMTGAAQHLLRNTFRSKRTQSSPS